MRQPRDRETQIREKVLRFIESEAKQSDKIVYYSPSQAVRLLERRGIFVTKDYIARRYDELSISNKNGLWMKKV